jgi:hypothetical protein
MFRFLLGLGAGIGISYLLKPKKQFLVYANYNRTGRNSDKENIEERFNTLSEAREFYNKLKKKKTVKGDFFFDYPSSFIMTGAKSNKRTEEELAEMKKEVKKETWKLSEIAICTGRCDNEDDFITEEVIK